MIMTQGPVLPPLSRIARSIPQDRDALWPVEGLVIPQVNWHLTSDTTSKADPITHLIQTWFKCQPFNTSDLHNWRNSHNWSKPANVIGQHVFLKPRNCGLVTFSWWHCRTWCHCSRGTLVMNQLQASIGNIQAKHPAVQVSYSLIFSRDDDRTYFRMQSGGFFLMWSLKTNNQVNSIDPHFHWRQLTQLNWTLRNSRQTSSMNQT